VGDIIEAEVPQSMLRQIGEQEWAFPKHPVSGLTVSHDQETSLRQVYRIECQPSLAIWNPRYQTKLLDMQREGKIAPQVLEQLANEQLMEAFIKEQ
jgi:hypothetical protein